MLVGESGSLDDSETTGQDDRFRPPRSSRPFSIDETVELNIRLRPAVLSSPGSFSSASITRDNRPLLKFAFSVMVATVRNGLLYLCASELQSNRILDPLEPSQTCISLYACTRDCSTSFQAPIESRKEIEAGVKLLARFEYSSDFGAQARTLDSGCDSINAILRSLVTGDDSTGGQNLSEMPLDISYSMLPPMQDPPALLQL